MPFIINIEHSQLIIQWPAEETTPLPKHKKIPFGAYYHDLMSFDPQYILNQFKNLAIFYHRAPSYYAQVVFGLTSSCLINVIFDS